jgi:hypothetical protein
MEHSTAAPRRRALVVSTSFMLRNSYASALELDGWLALEACSTDEVLWCLVAARMGEAGPIELVVADAETPGVQVLLREVNDSPNPPTLVFVGRGRAPTIPPPTGIAWVRDGRSGDELRQVVSRTVEVAHDVV